MLRRARIWMEAGLVAAVFGFTGLLDAMAIIAQMACYICGIFFVLSLLFSLFEDATPQVNRGVATVFYDRPSGLNGGSMHSQPRAGLGAPSAVRVNSPA